MVRTTSCRASVTRASPRNLHLPVYRDSTRKGALIPATGGPPAAIRQRRRNETSMSPTGSSSTRCELLKLGAVAGLGAAGLSSFACSRGESKDQIVASRPEEFQKLDAADQFNLVNYTLFIHEFDTLVELDESGKIVPSLAESWEASPDGLSSTFMLR